jgi:ATP-dependent DNA helicase RecG
MNVTAGYFELHLEESLSTDLTDLRGIGPKTAERLEERDIDDQLELLLLIPRKYQRIARYLDGLEMAREHPGYIEAIGRILHVEEPPSHSNAPTEVVVDARGQHVTLLWFNEPYPGFTDQFRSAEWVEFEGEVDWTGKAPSIAHPDQFDTLKRRPDLPEPSVSLEPVYTSMEGIPESRLRSAIEQAANRILPELVDIVPARLRDAHDLGTVEEALTTIHLLEPADDPDAFERELERARHRLVYEEFYTLQRELAEAYVEERRAAEAPECTNRDLGRALVRSLPFEMTDDQKEVSARLAEDLGERMPMRRLLQGDVGSGKTAVAFAMAAICMGSGQQAAMMAPTDILARQHYDRAEELFESFDLELELVTGSLTAAQRREAAERLERGDADFAIGTHALFQEGVGFESLGFIVVDEQHKFGVEQRDALLDKGRDPHLLAMTATPIPRSLAHAVFGDLDLAVIREKPPGRTPVDTYLRRRYAADDVYDYLSRRTRETGEQAYMVYPLVEPSEEVPHRKSAVESAERLANGALSEVRVGILHGQMDDETKHDTMERFAAGEIDVLCATTVVEVGMDVPNATMMVIESPEVFGLSQLHQLRGRVGRSSADSMCVLLAGRNLTEEARERLQSFSGTDDGFELAEVDLEIRGPGQFLGSRQSGRAEFRFGDLVRDADLLEDARRDARREVMGDVASRSPAS